MTGFIEDVLTTLGADDLFEASGIPDAYATAGEVNDIFELQSTLLAQLEEASGQLSALLDSGLIEAGGQTLQAFNLISDLTETIGNFTELWTNLSSAADIGGLTGGLSLLGSMAGQVATGFAALSGTLGLIAGVVGTGGNPLALAAFGLGTAGTALAAVQQAVGTEFNTLLETLDNVFDRAVQSGETVVIEPVEGGGSGGGGKPPITVEPGEGWGETVIEPGEFEEYDFGQEEPPEQDPPDPPEESDLPFEDLVEGDPDNDFGQRPPGLGPPPGDFLTDFFSDPAPGFGGPAPGGGGPGPGGGSPGRSGPSFPPGDEPGRRDPLVLDLDGDGIELIDPGAPPVFFDADGDGIATLTGWVDPDDGLLARDLDGNGAIGTQAELFGSATVDAITDLAESDANGDGRIDAADPVWGTLRLWRDLDGSGTSAPGELATMAEAGIASVSLDAERLGYLNGQNLVFSTTEWRATSGEVGAAAAVFFGIDALLSRTLPEAELDPALFALPRLKGFGEVADLAVAMGEDPALRAAVESLAAEAPGLTGAALRDRFEAIALDWAGVAGVDPGPTAEGENLRHRAFVEAVRGEARPPATDPLSVAATSNAYDTLIDSFLLRFLADMPRSQLQRAATPEEAEAALTSPFIAHAVLDVSVESGALDNSIGRLLYEIMDRLPEDPGAAIDRLAQTLPAVHALREEYYGDVVLVGQVGFANPEFDTFVEETLDRGLPDPFLRAFAEDALYALEQTVGGDGAESFAISHDAYTGRSGRDRRLIEPGGGDDTVDGGANSLGDTVAALVYRRGDGDDTVLAGEAGYLHRLYLPDIPAGEVTLLREAGADPALTVEILGGGSVRFEGGDPALGFALEVLTGDGETITEATPRVVNGGSPGDPVGPAGDTTYVVTAGAGALTIDEGQDDGDADRLVLPGLGPGDILSERDGTDLVVTLPGGVDSARVLDQYSTPFFGNRQLIRVERVEFGDGTVLDAAGMLDLSYPPLQTAGADLIEGSRFAETIPLGAGDDTLRGAQGGDTYLRPADATGADGIEDNGGSDGDALVLEGVTLAALAVAAEGNDALLTLPGGSLRLVNQFAGGAQDVIEAVTLDDAVLGPADLRALAVPEGGGDDTLPAGPAGEEITGTNAAAETLDGLGGPDTLNGRGGDDVYLWRAGGGDDLIDEGGDRASASVDRLVLEGLAPADVALTRLPGSDLSIEILATGETLTVDRQFAGNGSSSMEFLVFADGTVLDAEAIRAASPFRGTDGAEEIDATGGDDILIGGPGDDTLDGSNGSDTYIFAPGDGADLIRDAAFAGTENTVRLTAVDPADLLVERILENGRPTSDARLIYAPGASVRIDGQLSGGTDIQRVAFDDGTVLDADEILALATVLGTDAAETLPGEGLVDPMGGDDRVEGDSRTDDTLIWRPGSGNDVYDDDGFDGGANAVRFEGLAAAGIALSRDGTDLVATHPPTGETVTVLGQFAEINNGRKAGVTRLLFEDGEVDRPAIANATLPPPAPTADEITGGYDPETLEGGAGADTLDGGSGSDTYLWRKGDGDDVIGDDAILRDENPSDDTLLLADVAADEAVSFARAGDGFDLAITIGETGETITLLGQLRTPAIETLEVAGGARVSFADLAVFVPFTGGPGPDVVVGDAGDNRLEGRGGNDTLEGGPGLDAYLWRPGDGSDLVDEQGAGDVGDALRLTGVAQADLSVTREGDDLLVTHLPTGETIRIADQLAAPEAGVEAVVIDDAILTPGQLFARAGGAVPTVAGSVQTGGWGPEVFDFPVGVDTVVTGGGPDVVEVPAGAGALRVEGVVRGPGGTRIDWAGEPFADFAALLAAATGTAAGVEIADGSGTVLLLAGLALSDLEADAFGLPRPPVLGTPEADTLRGTLLDDVLSGSAGDDILVPLAGRDTVEGGAGTDTLWLAGAADGYRIERAGDTVTITDTDPGDGDEGVKTVTGTEAAAFLADGAVVALAEVTGEPAPPEGVIRGTGRDDVLASGAGAIYLPGEGTDTLLVGPAAVPGETAVLDAGAGDIVQLAGGLAIAGFVLTPDALGLDLASGASVQVLNAAGAVFEPGGNATTGATGPALSYAEFAAQVLGAAVPASGAVTGGAAVVPAATGTETVPPGGGPPAPPEGVIRGTAREDTLLTGAGTILLPGGGADTVVVSQAATPGETSVVESAAGDAVELAGGLEIEGFTLTPTALALTLASGATVQVLEAQALVFRPGGNATAGQGAPELDYAAFARTVLGVTVPENGLATGGPVTIPEAMLVEGEAGEFF